MMPPGFNSFGIKCVLVKNPTEDSGLNCSPSLSISGLIPVLPWARLFLSLLRVSVMFSAVRSKLTVYGTQSFRRCRDLSETYGSRKNYPKGDPHFLFFLLAIGRHVAVTY